MVLVLVVLGGVVAVAESCIMSTVGVTVVKVSISALALFLVLAMEEMA
jgi:hypothetical protein